MWPVLGRGRCSLSLVEADYRAHYVSAFDRTWKAPDDDVNAVADLDPLRGGTLPTPDLSLLKSPKRPPRET